MNENSLLLCNKKEKWSFLVYQIEIVYEFSGFKSCLLNLFFTCKACAWRDDIQDR